MKKASKIEILLHGGLLCALACGKNDKLSTPQIKKNITKWSISYDHAHGHLHGFG
jgi:hypothetical protein